MSWQHRLATHLGRARTVLIGALLVGPLLAFGGRTWWARSMIVALLSLLLFVGALGVLVEGRLRLIRGPLVPLGLALLALAAIQLLPLPAPLAGRISPRSQQAYALGWLADAVRADDPGAEIPSIGSSRTPISLDRSATLRWLGGAATCLLFGLAVGQHVDRVGRLLAVWGSLTGGLCFCTAFGLIQVVSGAHGLYGGIIPGQGPAWAPSTAEIWALPGTTYLKPLSDGPRGSTGRWVLPRTVPAPAVAGLPGGPAAFAGLAALALPLTLALALHLIAPRGSRETLTTRLFHSPTGGVALLLGMLLPLASGLAGWAAGGVGSLPIALGLAVVGFPAARGAGIRAVAWPLTGLALLALAFGASRGGDAGEPNRARFQSESAGRRGSWAEALRIAREFPLCGTGLGSFPTIHAYYKADDAGEGAAPSSLARFGAESGLAGLAIVGLAVLWCVWQLPGAMRKVGTADRLLAFGVVGAAVSFGLYSAVSWSVELPALALAGAGLAGMAHRWLAGGADLFAEAA